ncbi:Abnormal spindle-like microcephaly-associated protein-like [Vitis vinifera]|uniref:Abnormal spindle-like microcephaly-associated protein-like n=1 Tax=Vitis vinifera TaxID=29760 RepID=A0A438EEB8_VITVI|nr:Abnormal spindle-like microcephaly-associated protein-like [Vitis vinifera]
MEQSQSSRKAQIKKEKSLKSLAKSLTVWLNFLFENPESCGCDVSRLVGVDQSRSVLANGKRDSWPGGGVGINGAWRSPKRQRDSMWQGDGGGDSDAGMFPSLIFSSLQLSLKEVCSFDDLKQRMRVYLSLGTCKEIFKVMTQVAKNIDEGRLKMKAHCPIVTDVGMKEKAIKILMCYNPIWLRIGLYIIFGGDSLLPNEDVNSDEEITLLKMIIEKQFFSHVGLAKAYAYNKLVEGLYRPGYFETMGNVILKRFLLLVLILDRAKSQSCLPIKYGIDGVDGGSPLLFSQRSNIKSSRQIIHDFLSSDIMHGEGNLLAHLVIVGYKVSYEQCCLTEYDFRVTDLFDDLQDGVRLCRTIQLLLHDSSILVKMVVPSDTHKKNLANCGIALQYLKQAGVSLYDDDGMVIVGEDVANGDKELTLSLLWNIFCSLAVTTSNQQNDISKNDISSPLEMLLKWIQAVCESYDFKIENFASLVDGKAMWCLLDYYFRKELHCSRSYNDPNERNGKKSIISATDCTDAAHNFILSQKLTTLLGNFPEVLQTSDILEHNGACNDRSVVILLVFLSSQLVVKRNTDQLNFHKLLGCTCQIPEGKRSSMGHLFMSYKAVENQEETGGQNAEDTVQKFKAIQAWWQNMVEQNHKCYVKPVASTSECFSATNAALTFKECCFRRSIEHRKYLKIKRAVSFLQTVIRAWLTVKQKSVVYKFSPIIVQKYSSGRLKQLETFGRYIIFMVDRHGFVKLKSSTLLIQKAVRRWISRKHQGRNMLAQDPSSPDPVKAASFDRRCTYEWTSRPKYTCTLSQMEKSSFIFQEKEMNDLRIKAAVKIQLAWRNFSVCNSHRNEYTAATQIQCCFHGWLLRRSFVQKKQAVINIQSHFRGWLLRKSFVKKKQTVRKIQGAFRGWLLRNLVKKQQAAIKLQSAFRGWSLRRSFVKKQQAAIKIQSDFRGLKCQRNFQIYKIATKSAIIMQSHLRGWIARKAVCRLRHQIVVIQVQSLPWLVDKEGPFAPKKSCDKDSKCFSMCKMLESISMLQYWVNAGTSSLRSASPNGCTLQASRGCFPSFQLKMLLTSVLKLQRWWRGVLFLNSRTKSAIIIQSHIRGWIARREATRERHRVVVIQSYWKGYLARKESRGQLVDLRLRVQKSATSVDDGMRIINRLLAALSELLSMKSVSGILHTCATLEAISSKFSKGKCPGSLVFLDALFFWLGIMKMFWIPPPHPHPPLLVTCLASTVCYMATAHSQICCEKLVAAGAINTLLKLIRSVSRSIPDQEVLKHALSTLRNLSRYPHLAEVLIDTRGSVETILWEFLRNKEEGYFLASELLKKICSNQKGVEALRNLPALLKRLHNLTEDLSRKANNEKRNIRGQAGRENTERRLKEAMELLKLTKNG